MKKLFSIKYSDNGISFATLIVAPGIGRSHDSSWLQQTDQLCQPCHPLFPIHFILVSSISLGLGNLCRIFLRVSSSCLGLFTRLACIPLIIAMAVAVFYAHKGDFFNTAKKRRYTCSVLLPYCLRVPVKSAWINS